MRSRRFIMMMSSIWNVPKICQMMWSIPRSSTPSIVTITSLMFLRNWDPPALYQEATTPVETFDSKMGFLLAGGERARYY